MSRFLVFDKSAASGKQGVRHALGSKGVLVLEPSGVLVSDHLFHVRIPWASLNRNCPAKIYGDHTLFSLVDERPGQGYLIERSRYTTDDEAARPLVHVCPGGLLVDWVLSEELLELIQTERNRFYERVEKPLSGGHRDVGGGAIRRVLIDQRKCSLDVSAPLRFPNFCPHTGDPCSEVALLQIEGSLRTLPWFVSSRWSNRSKWVPILQTVTAALALLVFLIIGYVVIVSPESTPELNELLINGLLSMGIFGCVPLLTWILRPGVRAVLDPENTDCVELTISDSEYFASFVELNR